MINQVESAAGWIIHQYPVRDHLLLLYILTPQRYFKAFYRLPKTKHGSQKPLSFCPYWISWKANKQAINIQTLEFCSFLTKFIDSYQNSEVLVEVSYR